MTSEGGEGIVEGGVCLLNDLHGLFALSHQSQPPRKYTLSKNIGYCADTASRCMPSLPFPPAESSWSKMTMG